MSRDQGPDRAIRSDNTHGPIGPTTTHLTDLLSCSEDCNTQGLVYESCSEGIEPSSPSWSQIATWEKPVQNWDQRMTDLPPTHHHPKNAPLMSHCGRTRATMRASHDSPHRPHNPHQGSLQATDQSTIRPPPRLVGATPCVCRLRQHKTATPINVLPAENDDKGNHSEPRPMALLLVANWDVSTRRGIESSLAAYARSSPREDGPEERNFAMLNR